MGGNIAAHVNIAVQVKRDNHALRQALKEKEQKLGAIQHELKATDASHRCATMIFRVVWSGYGTSLHITH